MVLTIMSNKSIWRAKIDTHRVPLRQSAEENVRGKGQEGVGTVRTDETRRWYERPRWEVEGNGDPHDRGFSQNQTDRCLKIRQGISTKKSKLIRFLRSSLVRTDTSQWACKKNRRMKSSYKRPEVFTANLGQQLGLGSKYSLDSEEF
jgi:hypothetical protein